LSVSELGRDEKINVQQPHLEPSPKSDKERQRATRRDKEQHGDFIVRLVIISGRSGSGKTIALHVLEDLGFYCIDNLPASLLGAMHKEIGTLHPNIAVSIDSRNLPADNYDFKGLLAELKQNYSSCDLIYLDAEENILINRFSETRRKHPLTSDSISLSEAIRNEDALLSPVANCATYVINTSKLNQHELHEIIRARIESLSSNINRLQLLIQSFGFKYGLPDNADFVFDVRCLPNPYWRQDLQQLSGLEQPVKDYLQQEGIVIKMLADLTEFIRNWVPKFQEQERSYLTIAIGCTGGVHRSVYIAEQLALACRQELSNVVVRHRELREVACQTN